MGYKAIYLPRHVPVRLVTVSGSSRIRVEIEGSAPLGYDPGDEWLFVFGDAYRRPVEPPLSEFQARALLRDITRYASERRAFYGRDPDQVQGYAPRPMSSSGLMRRDDVSSCDDSQGDRSRPEDNVVLLRFRQVEQHEDDV